MINVGAVVAPLNPSPADAVVELDAFEAAEEVPVPGGAAELAVGDSLEPDLLLARDDALDGRVLDRRQLALTELALGIAGTRLLDLGRTQQASDMIGPERRHAGRHVFVLLIHPS